VEGEGKYLDTEKQCLEQNRMSKENNQNRKDLNEVLGEYQNLFELVPCIITVQDRDYKLIEYNRQFAEMFSPKPGEYCYQAYKGRDEPCVLCPVEKTFQDGQSHWSEETGLLEDGTIAHWVVKTAPVKNSKGEIVAAMEMSLDITQMKELEERLNELRQQGKFLLSKDIHSYMFTFTSWRELKNIHLEFGSLEGREAGGVPI